MGKKHNFCVTIDIPASTYTHEFEIDEDNLSYDEINELIDDPMNFAGKYSGLHNDEWELECEYGEQVISSVEYEDPEGNKKEWK